MQILFLTITLTAITCCYFMDTILLRAKPHPSLLRKRHEEARVLSPKYERRLLNIIRRENFSD